jgi:hypothetical protein
MIQKGKGNDAVRVRPVRQKLSGVRYNDGIREDRNIR